MSEIFGSDWTRRDLLRRVGDASQLAGIRRATLLDGRERGVKVFEFRTGGGLNFTVVPSRGMDIANAEFRGTPLAWISPSGLTAPDFFDPNDALRSFSGGLLTTCGMMNVGPAGEDEGEELPFHGRVSNIPAHQVTADARWERDRLTLTTQGIVRETSASGYTLELTRNISSVAGSRKIRISDIVENIGFRDAPFMFLYHINAGFPVVDEGSELVLAAQNAEPRDAVAEAGLADRLRFSAPVADFKEQVFYHDTVADENRHVWAAVINKRHNDGEGIGLYVRYHKTQFPNFIEWKMMGEGTYVVGMEPANCRVEGRAAERAADTLESIEVGGRRHFETEIGVLVGQEEIAEFEERVASVRSNS
jgi:hypothetical protein